MILILASLSFEPPPQGLVPLHRSIHLCPVQDCGVLQKALVGACVARHERLDGVFQRAGRRGPGNKGGQGKVSRVGSTLHFFNSSIASLWVSIVIVVNSSSSSSSSSNNDTSSYGSSPPCTLNFVWAMKKDKYLHLRKQYRFPHIMILERPWFWREDPVDKDRKWYFFGWDYLNG